DQSSNEKLLGAYEKLYYFELDRKEKLFTRFPILLAFYSIILGALASYLSNLPEGKPYLLIIFYVAAAGQIVCVVWSACYTYRFLYSDNYDYLLPDAAEGDSVSFEEDLADVSAASDSNESETEVDVVRILIDKYSSSILQNFDLNKTRNADFFKATNLIVLGLVFAFAGAFPYFTLRENSKSRIQRVAIDSVVKVNIMPDTVIKPKPEQSSSIPTDSTPPPSQKKRDATGLGVYRLRDRHTSAESKKNGEWVRRK
ncbi:MAG: hypothetical protein ABIQ57_05560, partial [Candidatus Kapaibacterium sp.]